MASGYNSYGGGDEVDEELALALLRSVLSHGEEQHWDEVKEFVLDESAKDDSNELRFVVIGETGSGKSETANSILMDRDMFESAMHASSVTKKCTVQKAIVCDDRPISIVDTPGLFDADMDSEDLLREITRCTMMTAPGPHAILLVIRIGRHSQQVQETVRIFRELFGEKCADYMIVVFTGKSTLSEVRRGCTIEEYIETLQKDVAEVLRDCKRRYVVFENKVDPQSEENKDQVDELLKTVDNMVRENHGRHYTSDMFEEAAAKMREQERLVRQEIEEEKQREMQVMREIYEEELRDIEREANEALFELISQNRDHTLEEIEQKYKKKDPKLEARKKIEKGHDIWNQFVDAVPTLLKIGQTVVRVFLSYQKGTLVADTPAHMANVINLTDDLIRSARAKGQKEKK